MIIKNQPVPPPVPAMKHVVDYDITEPSARRSMSNVPSCHHAFTTEISDKSRHRKSFRAYHSAYTGRRSYLGLFPFFRRTRGLKG